MNFEDYEKLGHLLKEARRIIFTQEWVSPKKAPINKHHEKAISHIDNLKDHLEEMMFIEHRKQANTHIFYGKQTSKNMVVEEKEEKKERKQTDDQV